MARRPYVPSSAPRPEGIISVKLAVVLLSTLLIAFGIVGCSSGSGTRRTLAPTVTEGSDVPTETPHATPLQPTPAPTPFVTEPRPTAATTFGNGTHRVIAEITPGLYRNSGSDGLCEWKRLSGLTGDPDDTIVGWTISGRTLVAIDVSDVAFFSHNCGTWSQDISPISADPTDPFGDGLYAVDYDIAPGTWMSDGPSQGCFWQRLGGFRGEDLDIKAKGVADVVEIAPKDTGFLTQGCGTWIKVE